MWTLKIKLLISLPQVLRGHCLNNVRKDLEWYHQRKCDLSFLSPAWLAVPYYGVDNCETVFQDFSTRFCPHMDVQNTSLLTTKRRIFERLILFNFSTRLHILILRKVLMRSKITNRKTGIIYIAELVYTVPNRSSVHSICDRHNPKQRANCIH